MDSAPEAELGLGGGVVGSDGMTSIGSGRGRRCDIVKVSVCGESESFPKVGC